MPDGDRYPDFIPRKFDKAQSCLEKAPELVGQAVTATVVKDFKRDLKTLELAIQCVVAEIEKFLSGDHEKRQLTVPNLVDLCKNRNEKLLARAALKLITFKLADAEGVTRVELRHAIACEYLHQQVEASFVSPVQFRVQQGTLVINPEFENALQRAVQESDALFDKALKPWSRSGDPKDIPQINGPSVEKQSIEQMMANNSHVAQISLEVLDDE